MRAAGDDELLLEADRDADLGLRAVASRVGLEIAGMQDRPLRIERSELIQRRPQEEAAGEETVPGFFGHDSRRQSVTRIGAGEAIEDVQFAPAR